MGQGTGILTLSPGDPSIKQEFRRERDFAHGRTYPQEGYNEMGEDRGDNGLEVVMTYKGWQGDC